jgi:hypothetical protein
MYKNARAPVTLSPVLVPAGGDAGDPDGVSLQAGSMMSSAAITPAHVQTHRHGVEILICLVAWG